MRSYRPQKIFYPSTYALTILNKEMNLNSEFFAKIWDQALIRHTVDGGSNSFHNFYENRILQDTTIKFPELTTGDFDSITPDVLKFLRDKGQTQIVQTDDQNETDFTKGLKVLQDFMQSNELTVDNVIAVVEPSGRLDQMLGNLDTLYKNPSGGNVHLYLMTSSTLTWLLPPDTSSIIEFQPLLNVKCGIVPLGGPTRIGSRGLKWELGNEVYNFGRTVSTSNIITSKSVEIEPQVNSVLFTIEMRAEDYHL